MTEPVSDDDRDRDEADERHDDDPVMRSMRSVWLSMREEEPPQGGLAELMAAARVKAETMAPAKEPWWQRLFATLRRPPVLALATVILLVGGGVIISKRRTEMKVEPDAPATTSVARERAQLQDKAAPPVADPASVTANAGSGAQIAMPDQVTEDGPPVNNGPRRRTPPRDPVAKPDPPKAKVEVGGGESAGPQKGAATGESDPVIAVDEEQTTTGTTRTPAPPPPPVVEPGADVSRPATIAQLVEQSAAAAKRGDCATVKTTSARIRKLNPAVYNDQIAKNAAIAKCLK